MLFSHFIYIATVKFNVYLMCVYENVTMPSKKKNFLSQK